MTPKLRNKLIHLWRLAIAATIVLTVAVALAACDDDDDGASTTPTATGGATSPAAETGTPTAAPTGDLSPTPTPTEEPFSGSRDPVEKDSPSVPPVAVQIDTRYAAHTDYDRVVFDFTDNMPGYVVEYVDPPILADGSGLEVDIEGAAFLQVRFTAAQAHDDQGNTTIDELEIMPGLMSILEIERTGDFEGQVTWVIGLPEELDFRVIDLTDPFRVAVDVAHP